LRGARSYLVGRRLARVRGVLVVGELAQLRDVALGESTRGQPSLLKRLQSSTSRAHIVAHLGEEVCISLQLE
jgi:hypothetical protein